MQAKKVLEFGLAGNCVSAIFEDPWASLRGNHPSPIVGDCGVNGETIRYRILYESAYHSNTLLDAVIVVVDPTSDENLYGRYLEDFHRRKQLRAQRGFLIAVCQPNSSSAPKRRISLDTIRESADVESFNFLEVEIAADDENERAMIDKIMEAVIASILREPKPKPLQRPPQRARAPVQKRERHRHCLIS